jgi:DNA-binding CsgD family transcriptional regulator
VAAAVAHLIDGPLTALLSHVSDLNGSSDRLPPGDDRGPSLKEVAADALREAERVCSLMQRIADAFEAPRETPAAAANGRDVIRWPSRVEKQGGRGLEAPAVVQERLTPREREVLRLVMEGCSNKEGATRLHISYRTFESHRAHLMRKLGAKNAVELMRLALLTPEAVRDVAGVDDNPAGDGGA